MEFIKRLDDYRAFWGSLEEKCRVYEKKWLFTEGLKQEREVWRKVEDYLSRCTVLELSYEYIARRQFEQELPYLLSIAR